MLTPNLRSNAFFIILSIGILVITNLYGQGASNALTFGGTDEYVTFGSAPQLRILDSLTIELWVNMPTAPGNNITFPINLYALVTYGTNGETQATNQIYRLQVTDIDLTSGLDYRYQIVHESGAGTDVVTTFTTPPVFGQWSHIVVQRDTTTSTYRLMVNGDVETPVTYADNLDPNGATSGIAILSGGFGSSPGSNTPPGGFLVGTMDEVRIWHTLVDTTTLRNWMNRKVTSSHPYFNKLAGYWRLDESTGFTATDETGNNDGTLMNMETTDWGTSTAPIGDASVFAESADITETASVPIDVVFGTGLNAPGAGFSLATIQVNQAPNTTSGLLSNVPNVYWEIWSEDTLFDGDFTATVRFHFDNVPGIADEVNLVLYRRNDATGTWSPTSATLFDEGNNFDGTGYFEITITELTAGGFSGQYILTSSDVDNPLPVQLSTFNAQIFQEGIKLLWETESELNNQGFEVWRSMDNEDNYVLVSSYQTNSDLQGAGNSNTKQNYEFFDSQVVEGHTYYYILWDVSYDGSRSSHGPLKVVFEKNSALSNQFTLSQNYPNPFNPSTQIPFQIFPVEGKNLFSTRLIITDLLGREIKTLVNDVLPAGTYTFSWDGRDNNNRIVSSGMYLYTLQVENRLFTKKMMFIH
ncbi:MAG: T9SS C-terminal target domain-containing protein [Calditrichaeota bacterium]|nr:MAG: T9SS C-terminal target domain-containing protein [Calditrichota bacterium]